MPIPFLRRNFKIIEKAKNRLSPLMPFPGRHLYTIHFAGYYSKFSHVLPHFILIDHVYKVDIILPFYRY